MPLKLPRLSRSRQSRSQVPHSTAAGPSTLQQPTTQADGPASIAANSNPETTSLAKRGNYGIHVLHDGGTEACVDIVFVHGLTGDAYDTWLHKATGVHWPKDLLKQDLPDIRILSYGYDADVVNIWNPASNSRLSSHAENQLATSCGSENEQRQKRGRSCSLLIALVDLSQSVLSPSQGRMLRNTFARLSAARLA